MIKRINRLIKELLDMIMADCGNCLHENMCPFRDDRNSGTGNSCWERGKGSYYIKKT